MSQHLMVDGQQGLTEFRDTTHQPGNYFIRLVAKILSYVFHPLFVPVYIAWFLVTVQPHLTGGGQPFQKIIAVLRFFIIYSFFPLVTVLLAKGLGFLESIYLRTQKERIIPYIACGIYYFWMWWVLRNQSEFSPEVVALAFAIFIASSIGLLLNIYMKVSMHAISMGILVTFMLLIAYTHAGTYAIWVAAAFLIAGAVCTSRFIVSDHTSREIYFGFFAGVLSQLIAIAIGTSLNG